MKFSQIDEELLLALDSFPELNIWTDLDKTRSLGKKMRQQIIGQLPPVEGVQHADYALPQDDGHNLIFRVYRPDTQIDPLPVLLWMHGGGYCLGAMENDDHIVRQFVKETGCIMVSVDYRLAPEFPYPIALNDCYAVLAWIADHSQELALNPLRIAVGGVSAGAGLAAALALYVRDHSDIKLAFQLLLCPMIDDRSVTPSIHQATDVRLWNRDSNLMGWKYYLGREKNADGKAADNTPIYAAASRAKDLGNLPPAYISVGTADGFIDENRDYADRLALHHVDVQLEIFVGGFHGFEFLVPAATIARDARNKHYAAIGKALLPARAT
tara:strand:+ start:4049 stop:5026 length:978 start_codon:yes stop_codon:yes gene_type:complete